MTLNLSFMTRILHGGFLLRFVTMVLLLFAFQSLRAQVPAAVDTFRIAGASMRFPVQEPSWSFRIGTGLQLVKPPADLLESAIQAPMFNLHMKYIFPYRLSAEADLSTIVVSNHLAAGPRYGVGIGKFCANAGWDVAFMYGQLRQAGFNNKTSVWMHYPNLSLGYRLNDIALTLKGEAVVVSRLSQVSDEKELTRTKNFFNGVTVAFYVEQRLWKDNVFIFGVKDNYEKFYWPTWMLFTTFNRFYHIPELSFMWIL